MLSQPIQHALCLHLYQPAGNLQRLLEQDAAELRRILACLERIPRHAAKYAATARLHLALSPVLLEQLQDPELVQACREISDIPAILDALRKAPNIEFIASGYRHAPLALIPERDWQDHLRRELDLMEQALGRRPKGYWSPGGATPALLDAVEAAGYRYLVLDADQLDCGNPAPADPYRCYRRADKASSKLALAPADPGFSRSQQLGLNAPWFADEVRNGVAVSPASAAPPLLTTWSDGENGEWFRRLDEENGFFGHFFSPYMEFCETGEFPLGPVLLSAYLEAHPPTEEASLRRDMAEPQRQGAALLERLHDLSDRYWRLIDGPAAARPSGDRLRQARELILNAQGGVFPTDDSLWQAAWEEALQAAEQLLGTVKPETAAKPPKDAPGSTPEPLGRTKAAKASPPVAPGQPPQTAVAPATASPARSKAGEPPLKTGPAKPAAPKPATAAPPKVEPQATVKSPARKGPAPKAATPGKSAPKTPMGKAPALEGAAAKATAEPPKAEPQTTAKSPARKGPAPKAATPGKSAPKAPKDKPPALEDAAAKVTAAPAAPAGAAPKRAVATKKKVPRKKATAPRQGPVKAPATAPSDAKPAAPSTANKTRATKRPVAKKTAAAPKKKAPTQGSVKNKATKPKGA